jgi:hypothetical protein
MAANKDEILDAISKMTVLEVVELISDMERVRRLRGCSGRVCRGSGRCRRRCRRSGRGADGIRRHAEGVPG